MSDQPLNSAQFAAMQAEMQRKIAATIEAMQLRRWAVEQAMAVAVTVDPNQLIEIAASIYDFVAKPALAVTVAGPSE